MELMAMAGLAFAAGVLSFTSPCCLPLMPGYVAYISSTGQHQPHDDDDDTAHLREHDAVGEQHGAHRRRACAEGGEDHTETGDEQQGAGQRTGPSCPSLHHRDGRDRGGGPS